MNSRIRKLQVEQLDKKIAPFMVNSVHSTIGKSWVELMRTGIGMNMRQLGKRLSKSAQAVQQIQEREKAGTITLNSLQETADAMGMQMVYAFVPKNGKTIHEFLEEKAMAVATEIVQRTNATMHLEDQQVAAERIKESIIELANELMQKPTQLWD